MSGGSIKNIPNMIQMKTMDEHLIPPMPVEGVDVQALKTIYTFWSLKR
jgi:hypothetical protein